jgi:hypothetical protein
VTEYPQQDYHDPGMPQTDEIPDIPVETEADAADATASSDDREVSADPGDEPEDDKKA